MRGRRFEVVILGADPAVPPPSNAPGILSIAAVIAGIFAVRALVKRP